jgi:ABC-2 type transport system permease protein
MTFRGYLKLAQVPFQMMLAYRTATLIWCLWGLLRIYLMRVFWTAVYGGGGAVEGITLPMMITYATLAGVQGFVTHCDVHWFVQHRVRDGGIVIDLLRPYGFLRSLFAWSVGDSLLWGGPMAGFTLAVSLLFVDLQPPASPVAGLAYLASLVLALGVNFLISTLVGLVAFWTLELFGFNVIVRFLSEFLSGGLVPLWFLPPWARWIAELLPFQSLAHLPLSIYVGKIEGAAISVALLKQAAWIAVLSALAWLIWKAAERKIIVQGG